jgi:hypothetical protein
VADESQLKILRQGLELHPARLGKQVDPKDQSAAACVYSTGPRPLLPASAARPRPVAVQAACYLLGRDQVPRALPCRL